MNAPHHANPLATLARIILVDQAKRMSDATPGALADRDPECVHDLRVAIRRARYALKLFPALKKDRHARALRDRLGRVFRILGGVRDYDVLRAAIVPQIDAVDASQPVRKAILDAIGAMRTEAFAAMHAALDAPAYRTLVAELTTVAADKRGNDGLGGNELDDAVHALAAKMVRRPLKKVCAWKDKGVRGDAAGHLHELRIKLRRLRYACEFLVEPVGKRMKKAAKACVAMQQILGGHQDARANVELLNRVARRLAGNRRAIQACDALARKQQETEAACRRTFKGGWRKFLDNVKRRLGEDGGLKLET